MMLRLFFLSGVLAMLPGCATTHAPAGSPGFNWSLEQTPLDRSAAEFSNQATEHLAWAAALRDRVVEVDGPRTVDNTLGPLNRMLMHVDAAAAESNLFARIHPRADMRTAAEEAEQAVEKFKSEVKLDRRLFEALQAVDTTGADAPTRYALLKLIRDSRRAGVEKDEATRRRIAVLNDEILKLGQQFAKNTREDEREIVLDSTAALQGMPHDWIGKHPPGPDGRVHVSTRYPDYYPVMAYAKSADARRRLYAEFKTRGYPANSTVLRSLLVKRFELAQLLGYANYADYITEDKMIGSAERARVFIERVSSLSEPTMEREYDRLLARKRRDEPNATAVEDWEKPYLEELLKAEEYGFDSQAVRAYLNFPDVRNGVFEVTGRLFGLTYREVTGLKLWHPDVTAWDVFEGLERLGRFYLDLHPRANKYGHAAEFDYRAGIEGIRLPQAVLVCNFPNPSESPDGLALMEHSEVVTFFHEFGHLLHALLAGRQRWVINSGIATEWDFVEAPSQLLEEWCFDAATLQSFARHHQTREPIPSELVVKLRAARDFGKGLWARHQMFYAAVSLHYYDCDPQDLDLDALAVELQGDYSPFLHVPDTRFQYSFGHLDGYSAIYYTYMWSFVISKDLFARFERSGLYNKRVAAEYRSRILEAGGSAPAAESIEAFLGRPESLEAFQRWLERN